MHLSSASPENGACGLVVVESQLNRNKLPWIQKLAELSIQEQQVLLLNSVSTMITVRKRNLIMEKL